ncbi:MULTISPECIES: restriction endonuclease subunit S [Anaerotruncus]|uniref:restriction endonuclease subunit S n=1 Tax=Anaerotruncus TaxID=244127 RepID=UPI000E51D293|nr:MULTISPECIES: restriction endonuclease subunit S [Anaerotruncus]RGX54557.1 restriction endonuclease subunit S [Anaerotruncus sp. AF02-27]
MGKVCLGDVARERRETCRTGGEGLARVGLEHLAPGEVTLAAWEEGTENTFTKMFRKGDILFGRRRAYLKKAAAAPFDGICSGDITVIEAIPGRIDPDLLPFVIQNDALFDFAVGGSAGSLSPRVKWEHLQNYRFELPEMEKQKRLAQMFWSVDRVRKAYKRLLQSTDELVKARFIELFGVPGSDTHGWGLKTLKDCCLLNPQKPKKFKKIPPETRCSFVAMPSVGEKGELDASIIRPYSEVCKGFTYFAENDVLFAKITPCMENGKGAVAKGLCNRLGFGSTEFHVLRPIPGVSDPYWLYAITIFEKFRRDAEKVMTGTGGQRRVPISYLADYAITLPPIDLQERFADFMRQSVRSKAELQQAASDLDAAYRRLLAENLG